MGVERLKSGHYRARIERDGKRLDLGVYATREEALRRLAAVREGPRREALTLGEFGEPWIAKRSKSNQSVWRARIASTSIVGRALASLQPRDVRAWLESQSGARQTRKNALNLLRVCLQAAVDMGKVRTNAARDVRVPKERRTHERWTWLRLPELYALLSRATEDERDLIAFAVGTGLRAGEQCGLHWADVGEREIIVRYGGPKGEPTKSGKPRVVPLFGLGREALTRWRARHPGESSDLVFGSRRSRYRILGRYVAGHDAGRAVYVERWDVLTYGAGLYDAEPTRPLVWHSLRHTCASLLVSGAWGRAWTLREVQELLGHSDASTTERYAHLCGTLASRAAIEHDSRR